MTGSRFAGLWRDADFLKLWTGQSVSLFGSVVGGFALDFVAIAVLGASPSQVALLRTAELAPGLLVGLYAGVWVDRLRRRPLLIAADLGRAALVASVPLAYALDVLRIGQLYVVALLVSVLRVLFDVSYLSYLPSLVRREQLTEANGKLAASASVAEVGGLGLGGALVQAVTAPGALVVDALSFLASALSLGLIRRPEPTPAPRGKDEHAWREIADGLRYVGGDASLRAIAGVSATMNLFRSMFGVVIMLYFIRTLELQPAVIGPLGALGGVSALVGALVAERVQRRFGVGRVLIGGLLVSGLVSLLIPLAAGPFALVLLFLATPQVVGDGAATMFEVTQTSLQQALAPDRLRGRVNASTRFLDWGAMLLGIFVGGLLGNAIGFRATLLVAGFGGLLTPLWIIYSPLRGLRTYPHGADAAFP